jgi:hypothetical protein
MSIFKKSSAVFVERMNLLRNVSVSEDKVLFNINYSNIELRPEEIPGFVSDLIQVYGIIKPTLDRLSQEKEEVEAKTTTPAVDDKPIDLSEIPF